MSADSRDTAPAATKPSAGAATKPSAGAAWFENEAFWTAYAPLMFDEAHWGEVPAVIDALLALTGLAPQDAAIKLSAGAAIKPSAGAATLRVLDSCCGVGRHSLELASRGFAVTGVDITAPYLDAARESARAANLDIEFLRGDIRRFSRPGGFNLAINLFTSFGYFSTLEEDITALSNIAESLAPGGHFVLETLGKETAVRDFIEGEWFERDGWTVLTEFSVVGAWEYLRNRWVLLRGEERIDHVFDVRLYSGVEIAQALKAAGFSRVQIYGGMDGRPYDQHALSLVAVAHR